MVLFCVAIVATIMCGVIKKPSLNILKGACALIGLASVIGSLLMPVGGYNDPKLISTSEIVCNNIVEEEIYLFDDGNSYIYCKKVEVSSEDEKYDVEIETLGYENVKVIEEENCSLPRIEEYISEGKNSIWTFGKEADKVEYVIHIPKGTTHKN